MKDISNALNNEVYNLAFIYAEYTHLLDINLHKININKDITIVSKYKKNIINFTNKLNFYN